eukprot:1165769-Lingulodinium_polyedra.AAC.1
MSGWYRGKGSDQQWDPQSSWGPQLWGQPQRGPQPWGLEWWQQEWGQDQWGQLWGIQHSYVLMYPASMPTPLTMPGRGTGRGNPPKGKGSA